MFFYKFVAVFSCLFLLFVPGGKVKLYRVKNKALPLNNTDAFYQNSATNVQAVSSSVQRGVTLSSSCSASTEPPVNHETREKIHIKQGFGADGKPCIEYLNDFFVLCIIRTLNAYFYCILAASKQDAQ